MNPFAWSLAILLSGCAASSPWILNTLETPASDSKRLFYRTPSSVATLEFTRSGSQISSYFSTLGRRLGRGSAAAARLRLGTEVLEEEVSLHEGRMRTRLPDDWTLKAIEALKEGREVAILVGSVEETIHPERFVTISKDFF